MECVCNGAIAQDEGGMDYCRIAVENANLKIENKDLQKIIDDYNKIIAEQDDVYAENERLRMAMEIITALKGDAE